MKKLIFLICVLFVTPSNQALSQIVEKRVNFKHGETDSIIVFKEYTIDTIVGSDTVFFVQFWHQEWLFDSLGVLVRHCLEKEYTNGLVYKGLNNGYWQISDSEISCFSEGAIAVNIRLFYQGNYIQTFFFNPGLDFLNLGLDKYFFLKDTLKFSKCPSDINYIDFFYPDTINVIVTKDSFSIKLNDILFIKEETKYINEVSADLERGLYNRKLQMFRDSIENVKSK